MGSGSSASTMIQSMQPPAAASAVASAVASAAVPLINKHLGNLGGILGKDSSINFMQLLTFAQWQMSCEADERKLLFTYFLILVTKKTLSQNAMVRFAHMFVEIGTEIMEKDVEGEAAKAWSDLQSAAEDPELDEIHTAEATWNKGMESLHRP